MNAAIRRSRQVNPASRPSDAASGTPLASALGVVAALLWIVQAAIIAAVVGKLAEGGLRGVYWYAGAYLAVGMLRSSMDAWAARRQFAAARASVTAMRAAAAAALARRSPLDAAGLPSGAAASVLGEQLEAVLPWLLRYQPARWRALLVPPIIAACIACWSWVPALILLAAAPLIPLFMAVIGWRAQAASEAQLQQQGGINGFLLDRLRGLATLRALDAVDLSARRLRACAEALRASTMKVLRIAFLSSTALELFSALGVALVAVYIGFHLLGEIDGGSWGRRLSLAEGLFILLLAPAFFEPLRDLSAAWHDKAAGEASRTALAAVLDGGLSLPDAGNAAAGATGAVAVDIAALAFQHRGEAPLFTNFDLHIRAGEHVALVGASGSGKTTLLSLIAGLAPWSAGAIRVGGIAAAAMGPRIGWIGQRPHIFAGSVGANVAMGRPAVTPAQVAAAIAFVGLDRVHHASAGDALGEGGAGLSGGELVRLSLARAAVTADCALLLADEPTAHLDRDSAAAVMDALIQLAQGRTLIIATHDRQLAARIGRVIDLDAPHGARRAA